MARYIDIDKAIENIRSGDGTSTQKLFAECCLLSVPIADVAPRSEGVWVYNPDGMDWGLGAWQCSLCACKNDNLPMDENIKPLQWAGAKYCPQCGAKMVGAKTKERIQDGLQKKIQ